ncbi:ABC transporter [Psychromonas sp. MB-3u-54]|uniref:MlaA family lipoprotein n=1 Tax=Psychromonas sp. MB-3u-54 TaxID=2058319 RepID=UPI000C349A76|nr:VacJ family lipoprotein [Psychromonas sp. MB-3u-54]PKH04301.1 ABC transporter [Psychromonas sp. MB-3u-54]
MLKLTFLIFLLFSTAPFAQTVNGDSQYQMRDPIEPVNRLIWEFNYKVLDTYLYRPVAKSYIYVMPNDGRKAIHNFVLNLEEPTTVLNNLIQLDFKHSFDALMRFTLNSTFGIFGLIDVGSAIGIERRRESFSNVLGRWSVANGPYLMVPVIGPRSTRKLVGDVVDGLFFPSSYLSLWQNVGLWGLDGAEIRAGFIDQEPLLEQSLDPYLFVKEAYIQYEAFKFYSNSTDVEHFMKKTTQEQKALDQNLDEFMDEIN